MDSESRFTGPITRIRRLIAVVGALLLVAPVSSAHETPPQWPTGEQLSKVTPVIDNVVPMARKLMSHMQDRLDIDQLQTLDQINHDLQVMQRVDAGYMGPRPDLTHFERARLVEYFHWKSQQSLLKLLASLKPPSVADMDFRQGQPGGGSQREGNDVQKQARPVPVDRTTGAVLLRVQLPSDPNEPEKRTPSKPRLTLATWDLAGESPTHFSVPVSGTGETYVLLDLQRVPLDQTISYLQFVDATNPQRAFTHALTFPATAYGQFALDVVDDKQASTPVLLQIAAAGSGLLQEPAEAVDLRNVLNDVVPHLNSSGRGYMFYLPGERRGRYWVVKPPLEMPLPAGQWELTVLRGLEYSPIRKTVTIKEDEWTRMELQPKRWTNMPRRGWYAGDDHVHAQLLTSEDARNVMAYCQAVDINIANILEMGDVMRTYYQQRGFGRSFRVQQGNHWLIPGQEDPRSVLGHAIGLNLKSKVRDLDRYLSNDWIAQQIHQQGGLYGHTHVGPKACFVEREMALFTPLEIVDFNSVMQASLGTELYYDFLNLGYKMTATAGADTPYGGTIGAVRTYAYTGDPQTCDPDQWFAAVKQGRTFVTNGPMIELAVNKAMPGDEILVDDAQVLHVQVKAWGDAGQSAPASLRLIKFGQVIEESQAVDPEDATLEIETKLKAGKGFWLAAHAVSHDGAEALTTPVYVTRKGFRRWDRSNAAALIDKQLKVLDVIEAEIKQAERVIKSNPNSLDYWNRRTAEQAGPLRQRLAATRAIYQDLLEQLKKELASD